MTFDPREQGRTEETRLARVDCLQEPEQALFAEQLARRVRGLGQGVSVEDYEISGIEPRRKLVVGGLIIKTQGQVTRIGRDLVQQPPPTGRGPIQEGPRVAGVADRE